MTERSAQDFDQVMAALGLLSAKLTCRAVSASSLLLDSTPELVHQQRTAARALLGLYDRKYAGQAMQVVASDPVFCDVAARFTELVQDTPLE